MTTQKHEDQDKRKMLSRRNLLMKIGLAAGAAYVAPSLAGFDIARASGASAGSGPGGSGGNGGGGGSRGGSAPSRGGNGGRGRGRNGSRPSRPGRRAHGHGRGRGPWVSRPSQRRDQQGRRDWSKPSRPGRQSRVSR